MTKNNSYKTPLGYYELSILEFKKAREEIQTELQNLKLVQASLAEFQELKTELKSSQKEIKALKAELQTTQHNLTISQKNANEAFSRAIAAENAIEEARTEIEDLKEFMSDRFTLSHTQMMKEFLELKKQMNQIQKQTQQIIQQSVETDNTKIELKQPLLNLQTQLSKLISELTLISPVSGADYTLLRNLLVAGEWKRADRETHFLMCRISNRYVEGWQWLDRGEIEKFPWQDFYIINRLWLESSEGKFGFSVQKQIWQSIEVANNDDFEVEKSLGDRLGWRKNNNWLSSKSFTFSLDAPEGHLPSTLHLLGIDKGRVEDRIRFLFSRPSLQF